MRILHVTIFEKPNGFQAQAPDSSKKLNLFDGSNLAYQSIIGAARQRLCVFVPRPACGSWLARTNLLSLINGTGSLD